MIRQFYSAMNTEGSRKITRGPTMFETWMDFNNSLIATGVFTCSLCKKIMVPPVVLSVQYGNICSFCFEKPENILDKEKCFENKALATIINNIHFPCCYKEKHCTQKLKLEDLPLHEQQCCYRTISCAFSTTCPWNGSKLDLVKHLLELHKEVALQSENDKFNIITSIDEENDNMNLLETSVGLFLIRIRISPKKSEMCINTCNLNEKPTKCEFRLKIESEQNQFSYKTGLKISPEIEAISTFKKDGTTVVDLGSLQKMLTTENHKTIRLIIKVVCKDDDMIIENSMLHHLKCPECSQLLRPPIYQCITGHTICAGCKLKLIQCSICQERYGNTRNYTLESLANKLRYPCQFESNGCKIKALLSSNHETACDYQPFDCLVTDCCFKGTYVYLMEHLRELHRNICFDSKEVVHFIKSLHKKKVSNMNMVCIINHNAIFKLTNHFDSAYIKWGVKMIAPHHDKSTYIYEIAIYDPNVTEKKFTQQDIIMNKQECIFCINKYDIQNCLNGGNMSYYFKITKNDSQKMQNLEDGCNVQNFISPCIKSLSNNIENMVLVDQSS